MPHPHSTLLNHPVHRAPARGQMLGALGAAKALAPMTVAMAQGRCGGDRAGTSACDTTPAKAPFAPTGWKTVALDHFAVQATDYKKEAAYYAALMNWKLRSEKISRSRLGCRTAR